VNAVRGVARSAPLLYLVPLVAGVVAWWTQGEAFGPQKLVGAALALAGAAIAQWRSLSARAFPESVT
jgi:drug/metabolite transporter (DMT)-like permease